MRKLGYVATALVLAVLVAMPSATRAQTDPRSRVCDSRCEFNRDRAALRHKTTRNPIPGYIVACESGGDYRAQNPSSSAGGKYQILWSTWISYIDLYVTKRVVRLAENLKTKIQARRHVKRHGRLDDGPRESSPLLQDIVAAKIWTHGGAGQWSCS